MSFNNSLEASSGPVEAAGANPGSLAGEAGDSEPIHHETLPDAANLVVSAPELIPEPVRCVEVPLSVRAA
jgi:hypothetical protein